MQRTFRTSDGYTFHLLADGTVADNLDPAKVDMSFTSLVALFAATDAQEICAGGRPALRGTCGKASCPCHTGWPNTLEYSCGCIYATTEPSRYYGHACAQCFVQTTGGKRW